MPYKYPNFDLRIPVETMQKLKYIADYNGRSANKEIEQIINKHIEYFERDNGKITLD